MGFNFWTRDWTLSRGELATRPLVKFSNLFCSCPGWLELKSFWYNDSFSFWQHHTACGILVLQSKIKYGSLAVKAQSPNHWNARDPPVIHSGIQCSGTMFFQFLFIILVWCLCFTWVAFFSCLMVFGCSLAFKTNTLRLIRLWSALQGWEMGMDWQVSIWVLGQGGNYLVGNIHKVSMHKSFSLVNFSSNLPCSWPSMLGM